MHGAADVASASQGMGKVGGCRSGWVMGVAAAEIVKQNGTENPAPRLIYLLIYKYPW